MLTGLCPEGYVEGLCSLRSGGDSACDAEGCGLPLCGNAYKVSVTGFTFSVIWHEKHYVDQPPPVASPPFGALRHHLPSAERWDNKALKSSPFISGSTSKHGLFCHRLRGKSREAGKGEAITQAECGWPVLRRPSGRLYGFIQTGAFYNLEAPTSTL